VWTSERAVTATSTSSSTPSAPSARASAKASSVFSRADAVAPVAKTRQRRSSSTQARFVTECCILATKVEQMGEELLARN